MRDARGRDRYCQEVEFAIGDKLIRCGDLQTPATIATRIVDLGDNQPYWFCEAHASHAIRNRGGVELEPVKKEERR